MRIHFVGARGVSMVKLALISASAGHTVTGSDIAISGHRPENADGADLVVYSAAVAPDNCELVRAKERGIPIKTRAEFLAEVSARYQNVIAVAGSHGKTTASAMAAEVFKKRNPTVHIGGDYRGFPDPVGGNEFFITEACEYKKSFLQLKPAVAVVLNAELDHTDCYKTGGEYFAAFGEFCAGAGHCIVCGDDPCLLQIAGKSGCVTFGLLPHNDYTAKNIMLTEGGGRAFDIYEQGVFLTRTQINCPGAHNLLNALAAAAAGRVYGLSAAEISDGLERFSAVGRRLEHLGSVGGAQIYSDYAHHPTELSAMLACARELGFKKVTAVFQPHTYSRTLSLYREFAKSLAVADEVFLLPVYAAREEPIAGVDSGLIAEEIKKTGGSAEYVTDIERLFRRLKASAAPGHAIFFAGAGTVDDHARKFTDRSRQT